MDKIALKKSTKLDYASMGAFGSAGRQNSENLAPSLRPPSLSIASTPRAT